jgi:hypothetical protein
VYLILQSKQNRENEPALDLITLYRQCLAAALRENGQSARHFRATLYPAHKRAGPGMRSAGENATPGRAIGWCSEAPPDLAAVL